MSIDSLNFFASSPLLDDIFETMPGDEIFGLDMIEREGQEYYELTDSFMDPPEIENEWVDPTWFKSEEELFEEMLNSQNFDVLLGEDYELSLLDFVVEESQISSCDVKLELAGVGSDTAFGLLDEVEKELKTETFKQEKEEPEEIIIKSVGSLGTKKLELENSISKDPENNINNLTGVVSLPKAKQKAKTSKVKHKAKGISKSDGKYRPQKLDCQSRSNESHQVMAEHDYVIRGTSKGCSTIGKAGTISRCNQNMKNNKECKEVHESNALNQNSIPVENKFMLALDAKVPPKTRHAPIPRKDAPPTASNVRPKPAPVPRKDITSQDKSLERKPQLASTSGKDIKYEQRPKPAPVPRKMTSILDSSKLKSIQDEKVEVKSFKDCQDHKSPNISLDDGFVSPNNSPKLSPKDSEKDCFSSVEDLNLGDLQHNDQSADGKDKNKKKLSLTDYKKLKQERVKQDSGTSQESKTSEISAGGDHNYCMPSQSHQTVAETSNSIITEKCKVPVMAATEVKSKPTSYINIEIEPKRLNQPPQARPNATKVEQNGSGVAEPFKNHFSHARPFRDPSRRFEDNNYRKRRASPIRNPEVVKKAMKHESQYSNSSWNTSVLTVFELPRRNSKYNNSTGFPSDVSSVSSPCQRSRSRSSSVSSTSSASSASSSTSKGRHSKNTRDNSSGPRKSQDQQRAIEERRIVYIGGLPSDYTKYDLKRKMQRFGDVLETSIHKRNKDEYYGFVTFETTAQAANAKQDGHKVPGCERFDFSYGGRREFCGTNYSDLDNEAVYRSNSSRNSQNSDFQDLLRQTMSMVQKSKRTS